MEGASVLQNISSLQKECPYSLLFANGQGKTFLLELNKGSLVYNQAEGQGPPGKPLSVIIITKAV